MTDAKSRKTIWGLDARQIHAAWWAGHGVQVVHRNSEFVADDGAEIFLLLSEGQLVHFDIAEVAERIVWTSLDSIRLRIIEKGKSRYREDVVRSPSGSVVHIKRSYGYAETEIAIVEFTKSSSVAGRWANPPAVASKRQFEPEHDLGALDQDAFGHAFDSRRRGDCEDYVRWIVAAWSDPHRVISGINEISPGVFAAEGDDALAGDVWLPPLWIGNSGRAGQSDVMVGPTFFWDDQTPSAGRGQAWTREIRDISPPKGRRAKRLLPRATMQGAIKRIFDFSAALLLSILLMPIGVIVALLVLVDDGRPVFFGHVRQTRGGRNFRCWKFRTMRKDAESLVSELRDKDQADGPQVFIEDDPRVTRIGKILRKYQIDEFPQLWNVIVGEMSLVGPRPSPDRENQFCPAWREMRLSVRPGITGLWQVRRTRAAGEDFQEWIKYDIEYVQTASFFLDFKILLKTIEVSLARN